MRQSGLTLTQIVEQLEGSEIPEYPPCLLANEVGELAQAGDEEATQQLGRMLESKEEDLRRIAYCWVVKLESPKLIEQLKTFARQPENKSVIDWASERFGLSLPA